MAADKKNLLLLFDRPTEPVFMEKGPNRAKFQVPASLLTDRYKNSPEIQDRFAADASIQIPVRANITIPNLKVPMSLDRKEQFSLFIPRHRRIAAHLINIFMGIFARTFLHKSVFPCLNNLKHNCILSGTGTLFELNYLNIRCIFMK